jgi:hypothetical protein
MIGLNIYLCIVSSDQTMIQRIQTLYLALAFIALVLLFFIPLATFISEMAYLKLYLTGLINPTPDGAVPFPLTYFLPQVIAAVAIAILSITSVFLYKNRAKQMQFINISVMLNILLILAIMFVYIPLIERKTGIKPDFASGVGIYLPVVSLMFLVLANRAIKRDDRLVRSADRLR